MATITRPEPASPSSGGAGRFARLPVAVACVFGLSSGVANADAWRVSPSLTLTSLLSSNPGFQAAGQRKADLVLSALPQVVLRGTGAGYRVEGSVGAEAVVYAARSRADRLWPAVHLNGNLRVVDRLFYIDGSFDAATSVADPLRSLADVSTNRALYVRERFSPYLERELSPGTTVLARSDNTFIQTRNGIVPGVSGDTALQTNVLRLDMRPQPFGVRADWIGNTTQFLDVAGSRVVYDTTRLNLLYAPSPELTLGLVGGSDHGQYTTNNIRETLKGVTLRWAPTVRTLLDARVEDRFFGRGWDVNLSHRSPFVAVAGEFSKRATTYASQIAALTAGTDVATLLDAALQTRIPNPVERAIAVQNLIIQRGLPATLANSAVLYSGIAGLQERAALSMALLGGIHTVTLRVYQQTTQDLLGPADTPPVLSSNARQRGASLNVTRRLSPEAAGTVSVSQVNIDGFGPNLGRESRSTGLRVSLTQNVNTRTSFTGGLRVQHVRSNSILATSADELALFAGVTHRF